MKETGIIFSGPSVVAIQRGLKTQTRRPLKLQPLGATLGFDFTIEPGQIWIYGGWPCRMEESRGRNKRDAGELTPVRLRCSYGVAGNRLWVRETYSRSALSVYPCPSAWYKADFDKYSDPAKVQEHTCPPDYQDYYSRKYGNFADCFACAGVRESKFRWSSAVHMPRRLSRLLLEISEVRVQRLQEITYNDVLAEGFSRFLTDEQQTDASHMAEAKQAYAVLWDSLNSKRGFPWSLNPWVWALTFRKINA